MFRSAPFRDAAGGIAQDGDNAAGIAVYVHESVAVDSVCAFPADGKPRLCLLDVNLFRISVPRQPRGQVILRIKQPGITGVGREQDQRNDGDEAPMVFGGLVLDVADLVAETKVPALDVSLARPVLDDLPAPAVGSGTPLETSAAYRRAGPTGHRDRLRGASAGLHWRGYPIG